MTATSRGDRVRDVWVLGAVCLVLLATLPPQADSIGSPAPFFRSLLSRRLAWRDLAQNLLLYAPFGIALAARRTSLPVFFGTASLLSLATELLQYSIPGRFPAARDVVVNTAGGVIAYAATRWTRRGRALVALLHRAERWLADARQPTPRMASRLLLWWAIAVTLVLTVTAILLRPAPPAVGSFAVVSPLLDPSSGPLRIGSDGGRSGHFSGTIDEVRIYSRARTSDEIRDDMARPTRGAGRAEGTLVAAYAFDAGSGTVARDETGSGHDGLVSNATWTAHGRSGGALTFDGRSSEVIVEPSPALDLREAMTLEAWVLSRDGPAVEPDVIYRSESVYFLEESSSTGGRRRATAGGRFGTAPVYTVARDPFRPGEWTHLATTYDGRAIRVYVNGSLAATRVHWSPHRPVRASLNTVELHAGPVRDARAFRATVLGDVALDIHVTCGPLNATLAPMFLITGLQSKQVVALNSSGTDLLVQHLSRASSFGLASPASRVRDALAACPAGATTRFTVNGHLQNPLVAREGRQLATSTPGLGSAWAFFVRTDLLPAWVLPAGALTYIALLAIPFGLWARRTMSTAGGVALAAGALVGLPYVYELRSINAGEAAALAVGAITGVLCRRTTPTPSRPVF